MNKIGWGILTTFILALIFEIYGLWPAMVLAGLVGSLFVNRSLQAFFVGFSGVAICWLVILIYGEIRHQIIPLMKLTDQIFMLTENLSFLLLFATLLLGGILGGLGGLNGLWWRRVIIKK